MIFLGFTFKEDLLVNFPDWKKSKTLTSQVWLQSEDERVAMSSINTYLDLLKG